MTPVTLYRANDGTLFEHRDDAIAHDQEKMASPEPCPFCGGTTVGAAGGPRWWVVCGDCGAEGPYRDTEKGAVVAWNTRTGEKARQSGSSRVCEFCVHSGARDGKAACGSPSFWAFQWFIAYSQVKPPTKDCPGFVPKIKEEG